MAHFLLVDDKPEIIETWGSWLLESGHSYQSANTYEQAVEAICSSEQGDDEPFDMILLDHELDGGFFGIHVLNEISRLLGQNYVEYRIVVITAHRNMELVRDYARWGVLGHLLKPTEQDQFFATIINALERRRLYVEYKDDWESAIKVLEDVGLLPNIKQMEDDLRNLEILKATYEDLLEKLKQAGGNEARLRESYEYAYQAITNDTSTVESIIPCLQSFLITRNFWQDVKRTFDCERLKFYGLRSYLLRIANNPNAYPIKHLSGQASGHYEYRTGITHRLYFRREGDRIVLERFGHKNEQKEILSFLHKTGGGDICTFDELGILEY